MDKERDEAGMYENTKLLNGYCHLVNKTLLFVQKYFEGIVPAGRLDRDLYWKTKKVYEQAEVLLQEDKITDLENLLEQYLEFANAYFEAGKPWETCREDRRTCRNTILNSVQLVANLTILLTPILEYPTGKVGKWLELTQNWNVQSVHSGYELPRTDMIAMVDTLSICI